LAESLKAMVRGGWFPEAWDIPVAIGLGVVITGYLGDTIAGFIGQWVPADWLNPVSELLIGVLMFMVGGFLGGDMSMWVRLFSFGAFAVGFADTVTIMLGLGPASAAVIKVIRPTQTQKTGNPGTRGIRYPLPSGEVLAYNEPAPGSLLPYRGGGRSVFSQETLTMVPTKSSTVTRGSVLGSRTKGQPPTRY